MTATLDLRRRLAKAVVERLRAEIPGLSAHIGEDYEQSCDPEAAVLRGKGTHFQWLAFAFAPWRMWDLHIGIVAVDAGHLSCGFHISERAKDLLLDGLDEVAAEFGAAAEHRPEAIEYQAILPPVEVAGATDESLAETIADLCRRMSALADRVSPPPEMR
ncbi:MAG: hypothetical protein QF654_01540 [Alphaproteobacteria bacterium]|jgi:hypothetical protein|nr:hypothetical protein [Alphaproteobacteria bacterium]